MNVPFIQVDKHWKTSKWQCEGVVGSSPSTFYMFYPLVGWFYHDAGR